MATTVMQMPPAPTQMVASSVDVWRAMKEMEQFVKVSKKWCMFNNISR